jgi:hypothetical protein
MNNFRQIKPLRVDESPYNFDRLLGLYHSGTLQGNFWYPPTGKKHLQYVYNQAKSGITRPFIDVNLSTASLNGTALLPRTTGGSTRQNYAVIMNHLQPCANIGVTGSEQPIPPLDILSVLYQNYRVMAAKVNFTFMLAPETVAAMEEMTNSTGEFDYWYAEIRFGLYLSDSSSRLTAWGTDAAGNPLTDSEVEQRIQENVQAGLLTTVPMTISNDPKYINNQATISTGWKQIKNQFQRSELDITDNTLFVGNLHSKLAGEDHDSISAPSTLLYAHPFMFVTKHLRKFGTTQNSTTLDTAISFDCSISYECNSIFQDPRIKFSEGESWI